MLRCGHRSICGRAGRGHGDFFVHPAQATPPGWAVSSFVLFVTFRDDTDTISATGKGARRLTATGCPRRSIGAILFWDHQYSGIGAMLLESGNRVG